MEQEHTQYQNSYGLTESDRQALEATAASFAGINIPPEQEEQPTPIENQEPEASFLSEAGAAAVGGAADAVESVGGFAELVGDTFKTGVGQLFGQPVDDTQNPFSKEYESGDAGWLDIPDDMVPENKTGLGKFVRGLVEFGVLTAATGGIGGKIGLAARVGARGTAALRAAGVGLQARKRINFIGKAAKIGAEGGIADLVSSSSESGNIANLASEHAPWLAPWITNALANDPEDNPWLARIKTVTAGAGMNWAGWGISAFAKGSWAAAKARKAGKSVDEANDIGNKAFNEELDKAEANHLEKHNEVADQRRQEGRGQSEISDPDARPDNYANAAKFDNTERPVTDNIGSAKQVARESIMDAKQGNKGDSHTQMLTDAALEQIARGNKTLKDIVLKSARELADEAFVKGGDLEDIGKINYNDLVLMFIKQTSEMTSMIDEGGDIAKRFGEYFKDSKKTNARVYITDGNKIVTASPTQKAALQLTIRNLAQRAQAIANGAYFIGDNVSVQRQVEMTLDAMKVAMTEHKKMGFMWGLDGKLQQLGTVPKSIKEATQKEIDKLTKEQDEYFSALHEMNKRGDYQSMKDLMELHHLSDGNIRTLEHIHDYLRKSLFGGKINGKAIKGRLRQELQGVFYNSVLSGPRTVVKAVFGTNLIGILRPFQALVGAKILRNQKEAAIAAAQIDALGSAFAEGFRMFKYNWDLGANRKTMSYEGKFDIETDLAEWQQMAGFYERYGTNLEKRAYDALNVIVNANTNPWMKYSQNAMGAGDALARTIIGRYEMRMRAARKAIDDGIDLKDVKEYARKYEENFREGPDGIFKLDANNRYVVSDKAAKLAGNEAAMTTALEENFKGFELISNIPFMKAFFPFVRTGFNALELTFAHTDLVRFRDKYKDIMEGINLDKYGIRPEDLGQAQALMKGRIYMGRSIIGMGTIAALAGNMTGNYPYNQEDREAWQKAGKKPFSFKVGNTYISYADLEPFNTLFSTTANIVENAHVLGEAWTEKWIDKLTYMAAAVLVDKSMLSGVEDLARLMNADTSEELLTQTGARYVRAHLPYAGLLGQLGDLMDANRREADDLWEHIIKRDAIFKSTLPPQYDYLSKDRTGKPLSYAADHPLTRLFNMVTPMPIYNAEGDPIKETLVEMRFNIPQIMSTYKGVPLDSFQRSELQKYMAMGDLRKNLEKIILRDPKFRQDLDKYKKENLNSSDEAYLYEQQFYQTVHEEFQRAKRVAMIDVIRNNPDLKEKIEIREGRKAASKSGNIDRLINMRNK